MYLAFLKKFRTYPKIQKCLWYLVRPIKTGFVLKLEQCKLQKKDLNSLEMRNCIFKSTGGVSVCHQMFRIVLLMITRSIYLSLYPPLD